MKDILANHLFAAVQLDEHVLLANNWLSKNYIYLPETTSETNEAKDNIIFNMTEVD